MDYREYPDFVVEDIIRLRRRLDHVDVPPRRTDHNFILGTWNIRSLGGYHDDWDENPGPPKRNLHGLALIAEVIRRFDVVAIQEVKRDTTALRLLSANFPGPHWGVMMSDVTAGDAGNVERSTYLYDTRRVTPSGLAGEIVLPPTESGDPPGAVRPHPYLVGFVAGGERFALLTAHIRYKDISDRVPELRKLAQYTAREIRDRSRDANAEEANLILLGDFNTDRNTTTDLFEVFLERGLWVPPELRNLKTTYGQQAKHYDQIAWFRDDMTLEPTGKAGTIDFACAVFQELTDRPMTYRVSDYFPLWCEFSTDRSAAALAGVLGLNPDEPVPFRHMQD